MYKQIIIVRKDLKMGKGKLASQVAHASLEAYKRVDEKIREEWEREGAKKVVLKVEGLKEMMDLKRELERAGIPCVVIRDAGRTQLRTGTVTSLGIGPVEENKIDKITKKLKLL